MDHESPISRPEEQVFKYQFVHSFLDPLNQSHPNVDNYQVLTKRYRTFYIDIDVKGSFAPRACPDGSSDNFDDKIVQMLFKSFEDYDYYVAGYCQDNNQAGLSKLFEKKKTEKSYSFHFYFTDLWIDINACDETTYDRVMLRDNHSYPFDYSVYQKTQCFRHPFFNKEKKDTAVSYGYFHPKGTANLIRTKDPLKFVIKELDYPFGQVSLKQIKTLDSMFLQMVKSDWCVKLEGHLCSHPLPFTRGAYAQSKYEIKVVDTEHKEISLEEVEQQIYKNMSPYARHHMKVVPCDITNLQVRREGVFNVCLGGLGDEMFIEIKNLLTQLILKSKNFVLYYRSDKDIDLETFLESMCYYNVEIMIQLYEPIILKGFDYLLLDERFFKSDFNPLYHSRAYTVEDRYPGYRKYFDLRTLKNEKMYVFERIDNNKMEITKLDYFHFQQLNLERLFEKRKQHLLVENQESKVEINLVEDNLYYSYQERKLGLRPNSETTAEAQGESPTAEV